MEDMVNGVSRTFWRGRRVFVTGNTGFKGSWLCSWLLELGAEVWGFALPPVGDNPLFTVLGLRDRLHHVDGDIRDYDVICRAVAEAKPDVVLHLAAQALVRLSYAEPKTTFDVNVGGGVNILEAVRNVTSVSACVFVTSDKCYENQSWPWGYRETDALGGSDPYSASKAAAEILAASYRAAFFGKGSPVGLATARAGNVIGGGDWSTDRLMPDCIRALWQGRPIELRNPAATRPWQHALDPLSGYLLLAQCLTENPGRYQGAWNFGPQPGAVMTVGEVAAEAVNCWGQGEVLVKSDDGPHEHGLLQLTIDKAMAQLGWRPKWSTRQAIDHTVQWYKDVLGGLKPLDVTREQILEYMAPASNGTRDL